jgi:lactoylglutathione lyase
MPPRCFPIAYVVDVERSARFYRELLGFEEHFRMPAEGPAGYVGLHLGEAQFGVVSAEWPRERIGAEPGSGVRFELFVYVDGVDDAVARMRAAGVTVQREPEDMPWGERIAYVADPDGNPVALAAPTPATPL